MGSSPTGRVVIEKYIFSFNKPSFLLAIYLIFSMTRVTRGFVARRRRKKILASVRGCRAGRSRLFRVANQQSIKSRFYMYSGRKNLKRTRRQLWIKRINASVRSNSELKYNTFIYILKKQMCCINRKSLSQLASLEPQFFQKLIHLTYG